MRVAFHSSHVHGDFASGQLGVQIVREDERAGVTRVDDVTFSVPADFHAHNDGVAAALMTLVGGEFRAVTFNFPISAHCAALLRDYYQLLDIGPVHESLEPRRPGARIGVTYSGGLDSTATVVLLRELLGEPAVVITADYSGRFTYERAGYVNVRQDLVCATDFRQKGFFRHGRFNFAVPLLFADYLDLYGVATGNPFPQERADMASLADGGQPPFLELAKPVRAGGLEELFLLRSLITPAILRILMTAAPQMLEAAFSAAGPPGGTKPYFKGLALRCLYRADDREPPAFLAALETPRRTLRFGEEQNNDLRALFVRRHGELDGLRRLMPTIADWDLSFADGLSQRFQERYNTNYVHHVPAELRQRLLRAFHRCGIYPYDERDWHELDILRQHVPSLRPEE